MAKHETQQDVNNQDEVAAYLKKNVTDKFLFVGHHLKWVPRHQSGKKHEHDFDIWWHHLKVGVVEVKCRDGQYTKDFYEKEGYMLDRPKLEYLHKQEKLFKFKALLVVRTADYAVYYARYEDLLANVDRWVKAPEHFMMTTNHGKETRKKPFKGYILPMDLFTIVGYMK